jgi:hypothetical protein
MMLLAAALDDDRIVVGSPPPPITPATIMGANTVAWWRADLGVTIGTGVSQWSDQSGNGFHLAQGTGANQPTFEASGGPNSTPSILFDGSNDRLINAAIDRPAPATTPTIIWMVVSQVTWTNGDRICGFGAAASHMSLTQNPVTPQWRMLNTVLVNTNAALTIGAWGRVEAGFLGTTSDYLKIIATNVAAGTSAGNTDPAAGFSLGTDPVGGLPGNFRISDLAIFDAQPSGAQTTDLDAYVTARYGAGLV